MIVANTDLRANAAKRSADVFFKFFAIFRREKDSIRIIQRVYHTSNRAINQILISHFFTINMLGFNFIQCLPKYAEIGCYVLIADVSNAPYDYFFWLINAIYVAQIKRTESGNGEYGRYFPIFKKLFEHLL